MLLQATLALSSVAAILGSPGGGQRTPHFPEWGVTYKAVTPSFDAMLMSLLFRFRPIGPTLVMDGDGCRRAFLQGNAATELKRKINVK